MRRGWEKKDVTVISWFPKTFLYRDSINLLLLRKHYRFLLQNLKYIGHSFGGKGKQVDLPQSALESSTGKGRHKSGWVLERPSSLAFLYASRWCEILLPGSHMQAEP